MPAYRSARRPASSADSRRYTGELGHALCRCPYTWRRPWKSVRSTSGWRCASHGGSAPVDVASTTSRPAATVRSTIASSSAKSYVSSSGCSVAQEKTLSVTVSIDARSNAAWSASHTSRGHCSGL